MYQRGPSDLCALVESNLVGQNFHLTGVQWKVLMNISAPNDQIYTYSAWHLPDLCTALTLLGSCHVNSRKNKTLDTWITVWSWLHNCKNSIFLILNLYQWTPVESLFLWLFLMLLLPRLYGHIVRHSVSRKTLQPTRKKNLMTSKKQVQGFCWKCHIWNWGIFTLVGHF